MSSLIKDAQGVDLMLDNKSIITAATVAVAAAALTCWLARRDSRAAFGPTAAVGVRTAGLAAVAVPKLGGLAGVEAVAQAV